MNILLTFPLFFKFRTSNFRCDVKVAFLNLEAEVAFRQDIPSHIKNRDLGDRNTEIKKNPESRGFSGFFEIFSGFFRDSLSFQYHDSDPRDFSFGIFSGFFLRF